MPAFIIPLMVMIAQRLRTRQHKVDFTCVSTATTASWCWVIMSLMRRAPRSRNWTAAFTVRWVTMSAQHRPTLANAKRVSPPLHPIPAQRPRVKNFAALADQPISFRGRICRLVRNGFALKFATRIQGWSLKLAICGRRKTMTSTIFRVESCLPAR